MSATYRTRVPGAKRELTEHELECVVGGRKIDASSPTLSSPAASGASFAEKNWWDTWLGK
jgi:hypothetical protein